MNGKLNNRILVIGAGVSGLTTALCLKKAGFDVKVVAENFTPQITSAVAGALWEWPPAVCGGEHNQDSVENAKKWCKASYAKFSQLAKHEETGVFLRPVVFYFKHRITSHLRELTKMVETQRFVKSFLHDPDLIARNGINPNLGLQDAYTYLAPMIDTDVYLPWLHYQNQQAGVSVVQKRISGSLKDLELEIKQEFDVELIVNCTGLGSVELANDSFLSPHRGALIRATNDGSTTARITTAHCMMFDKYQGNQNMIFILPRGENKLLLGGLVEPDQWSTDINLGNYSLIPDMLERCIEFMPSLKDVQLDLDETVRVGLRPYRKYCIRLEQEPETSIIHNYGHGGSGVTYSWGCADEVVSLAKEMLSNKLTVAA